MNPPLKGPRNHLDKLLQDDLNRLLDRIAAIARVGTAAESERQQPDLRARIEQAEAALARLRLDLLERYGEWQRALEECENLWALAELERDAPPVPVGLRAA